MDPQDPIFFWFGYCRPGRNTYTVQHRPNKEKQLYEDRFAAVTREALEETKGGATAAAAELRSQSRTKAGKPNFYVHHMLNTFRKEQVHHYVNPRHIRKDTTPVVYESAQFREDSSETY